MLKDLDYRQNLLLEKIENYEVLQNEIKMKHSHDRSTLDLMSIEQVDELNKSIEKLKETENNAAKDIALLLVYMSKETSQVKIKKAS